MEAMNLPALKKQIGFEHPIIGVHMRSGDGCRYGTAFLEHLFPLPSKLLISNTVIRLASHLQRECCRSSSLLETVLTAAGLHAQA